jgi:pseudaminic acid cytidylyltransferase
MRLAVIPARGGSKRIPRKNIKEFCGLPMIARSITAALNSNCFDQVIVSTEDTEIAEIAIKLGASAPFMRPLDLADDFVGTMPVIRHAIDWYTQHGHTISEVCCIYATAPFISAENIRTGYQALMAQQSNFAFSVTSFAFPIQRAIRITADHHVEMFDPSQFNTRSQDLEEAYHDAGQFYWGTAQAWMTSEAIFKAGSIPIVIPRHLVQDIDTPEDWVRAEWLFKAMQQHS